MNTQELMQAFSDLTNDDLQAVLDGASLMVVQDKSLTLGKSDSAFVIYELGDESYASPAELQAHLIAQAQPMLEEYYRFNPLSRESFQQQLTAQMAALGDFAFVAFPKKPAQYVFFVENGALIAEDNTSGRYKYGMFLTLEEDFQPAARLNKVKNWIQSGTAYGDYISINVCRFSAME